VRRPSRSLLAAAGLAVAATCAGCTGDGGTEVDLTTPRGGASAALEDSTAEPTATQPTAATPSGDPSASVGGLVLGFPSDLLPLYPGAEVVLSGAAPAADGRLQVSLAGRTGDGADSVVDFYRRALTAAGFTEAPPAPGQGATTAAFARTGGAEVVTVAVVSSGGQQQFTVGGSIAAPPP